MDFQDVIDRWVAIESSDLHIKAPNKPMWRVNGDLLPVEKSEPLSEADVVAITKSLVSQEEYEKFVSENELDTAKTLDCGRRIRINVHRQSGGIGLALRLLPAEFFPLESLGISEKICSEICALRKGLVLVTGATGSGKSTTLASFINEINETRAEHIITIEDPIEYKHSSKKCLVTQREVGADTASFSESLRRALREDPDIVLVGEMRDLDTMRAALTLAETGHLTFATLHTSTAVQTITRIIGAFPANEQEQIRVQLAGVLKYVLCQQLIPRTDVKGRCLAAEILVANNAVLSLIRENRIHQMQSTMQTSSRLGMITLNQSLENLVSKGYINQETAQSYAIDKDY